MKKNIKKILFAILSLFLLLSCVTIMATATETVSIAGDVNFDGKLTSDDARLILRASVGLETLKPPEGSGTDMDFILGDIDMNGKISAIDARICIRAVVGLGSLSPIVTDIPITESTANYLPSDDAITAEYKYDYGEHTLEIKVNDWASFCCGDFELKYDDSINIINITMPYLYNSVYDYNDSDGIRFSYAISDNSQSFEKSASLLTITFEKTTLEKFPEFILSGKARFNSERYVSIDKKIIAEQKCGDNLTWKFKEATGELIVEGTGDMTSTPWWSMKTHIKKVEIENGVTSIGSSAFSGCTSLTNITIPDSVTTIGPMSFSGCENLSDVYFEGDENQWNAINIDYDNECLTNATIHFNSTTPEETTTVPEETTAAPEETTTAAEEATTAPDTSDETTEEKNFLENFLETLIDVFFKAIEWLKNLFN